MSRTQHATTGFVLGFVLAPRTDETKLAVAAAVQDCATHSGVVTLLVTLDLSPALQISASSSRDSADMSRRQHMHLLLFPRTTHLCEPYAMRDYNNDTEAEQLYAPTGLTPVLASVAIPSALTH